MDTDFIDGGCPGPLILILPIGHRRTVQQELELQTIAFLVTGYCFPVHHSSGFLGAGWNRCQAGHDRCQIGRGYFLWLRHGLHLRRLLLLHGRHICLLLGRHNWQRLNCRLHLNFCRCRWGSQFKVNYLLVRCKLGTSMRFIPNRDAYLVISSIFRIGVPFPGLFGRVLVYRLPYVTSRRPF